VPSDRRLLPGPAEVVAEIDARSGTPTDLLLVGLLRRDDTWPLSSATLSLNTARSLGAGTTLRYAGTR
jgi:hypothetical protein